MNRETPYTPVYKRALFALLSTCLVLGMLPTYAFGSGETPATAERPAIVSEEVAVGSDPGVPAEEVLDAGAGDVAGELPKTDASSDGGAKPTDPISGDTAKTPGQVTADVPISGNSKTHKTLLVDGLEYTIDLDTHTAALVGWYGVAPSGDLAVPSQVADNGVVCTIVALGDLSDLPNGSNDEISNKTSDAKSEKRWGGVHIQCLRT